MISSSTLNEKWLKDFKDVSLEKIKFLYVARVNPEKGIYEFLEMFKNIKFEAEISIIGKTKNLTLLKKFKNIIDKSDNIKFPGYISDRKLLLKLTITTTFSYYPLSLRGNLMLWTSR